MDIQATPAPQRGENYLKNTFRSAKSQWEYGLEFEQAMREAGIDCPDRIVSDGKIHRFKPNGKRKPSGWYVFHGYAGCFGDWSQDIKEKWNTKNPSLTPREREQMREEKEKARLALQEEIARKNQEASETALKDWDGFAEKGQSAYLLKKKVDAVGIRFGQGYLVMPLCDAEGKMWSYQKIYANGGKYLLEGGRKKECFHVLGQLQDGKPIKVTEGYSTGSSVYMATGETVVVAIDAGNIEPVMASLKQKYPNSTITIAGDDDWHKPVNMGKIKAEEAAKKHDCQVILPIFKNREQYNDLPESQKPTDWNDLHVLEGLNQVREQLCGGGGNNVTNVTNLSQTLMEQDFQNVTLNVTSSPSTLQTLHSSCIERENQWFNTKALLIRNLTEDDQRCLAQKYSDQAVLKLPDDPLTLTSLPSFVREVIILSPKVNEAEQKKDRYAKRILQKKGCAVSLIYGSEGFKPDGQHPTEEFHKLFAQAIDHLEMPSYLTEMTSANDLFHYKIKEPEHLIDNILPAVGVSILAGHPKQGKSWMVLNFIKAMMKREYAFGEFKVKPVGVLYYALEDNSSRLKQRLQMVFEEENPSVKNLIVRTYSQRLNDQTIEEIKTFFIENPSMKFLIIDPYQKMRPVVTDKNSLDSYQKDYRDMSILKELAEELEISILVVHHLKKDKIANDSDLSSLNGSMGLSGSADTILMIQKEEDKITLKITGKDIEERSLILGVNLDTWVMSVDESEKIAVKGLQGEILNCLKVQNKPLRSKEIAHFLGKEDSSGYNSVRNQLKILKEKKQIDSPSRGVYQIENVTFVTSSNPHVTLNVTSANPCGIRDTGSNVTFVTPNLPTLEIEEVTI